MTDGRSAPLRSATVLLLAHTSRLPAGLGKSVFEALALAATMADPRRVAVAHRWAAANRTGGVDRWRTMLGVLAHRGRTLVELWTPVFERPEDLRQRVDLEGREHLDVLAGRPGIVLGFHLGTALTKWACAVNGYNIVVAGAGGQHFFGRAPAQPGWSIDPSRERISIASAGHGARGRAVALLRLRELLKSSVTIAIAGDGQNGRELFRVALPAGSFVMRSGWWLLRRKTGAPVVPILGYRAGDRVVIRAYPPLPPPIADSDEDVEQCRALLAPLIRQFVVDHPEQCLPWTFGN